MIYADIAGRFDPRDYARELHGPGQRTAGWPTHKHRDRQRRRRAASAARARRAEARRVARAKRGRRAAA